MGHLIVFFVVLAIIVAILSFLKDHFCKILGLAVLAVIGYYSIQYYKIAIPLIASIILFVTLYAYTERKKRIKEISNWISREIPPCEINEIITILDQADYEKFDNNQNTEYKFKGSSIPYGRANAFLNFFKKNIQNESPIFFSIIKSKINDEIREYGTLITENGIYLSNQYEVIKDNEKNINVSDDFFPFKGAINVAYFKEDKSKICIKYINNNADGYEEKFIMQNKTTLSIEFIYNLYSYLIENNFTRLLYIANSKNIDILERYNKIVENKFNYIDMSDVVAKTSTEVNFQQHFDVYNENKGLMDGARGAGYAAEYGNTTIDRLLLKKVTNTAQQLDEHGHQVKAGPDKNVNGVNIQTKYYKSASESIGAAFEKGSPKYLNEDGTMMPIEVPRDQYDVALNCMEKRIEKGQVPGADPKNAKVEAKKYVKKGYFTYEQSHLIAQAGTIEGIVVDLAQGVITSTYAAGISGLIVFANAIWNGASTQDAAKACLSASLQTLGKGAMIYTLTMQLSRKQFANYFKRKYVGGGTVAAGFEGINNPLYTISNDLAEKIANSSIAKSSLGKTIGISNITGKAIISAGVMSVIVFGPDIVKTLRGKISGKQLLKNSTVGATALAGGALGQLLIPIPVLGGMIGGVTAGWIAKKTLDNYILDDRIFMFQIFKEEFIECTMLIPLSQSEFDNVVSNTIGHKDLENILENMYASDMPRKYANYFISSIIVELIGRRKKITNNLINDGVYETTAEFLGIEYDLG